MLDMKTIRQQPETIQQAADQKGIAFSVHELLTQDDHKRELLQEVENLRRFRNEASVNVSMLIHSGDTRAADDLREQVKTNNSKLSLLEEELERVKRQLEVLMLLAPNLTSPDTPVGKSDADNVEVRRFGEQPNFDFEPKDHVTLGEKLDLLDLARGVKVAGTRNYYLKGAGVLLHRAVQQLAVDLLLTRGFTLLDVPLMVREEALVNTGFFPLGADQTYEVAQEAKWLVGTSEVPLISYYGQEIIDVRRPIKLAAVSSCFRSEVGSAGRDVRGLYRVHQFAKVEQVVFCENNHELSEDILQELTRNAEDLLQLLELPYRVVAVCAGDMSQKTYKQYDIETWMPSRQAYGETHSSSNLGDFQARRSNIRYRDAAGRLQYCHTLNNTAVASPRILIPLLENHQNADGSIRIPAALQKYMCGMELLVPSEVDEVGLMKGAQHQNKSLPERRTNA
ncbi:MAG: serine--tRNA ligase [Gorillibacterium sp.]|nr:serine--tRNA ligase [Gorillibacterium sp.]